MGSLVEFWLLVLDSLKYSRVKSPKNRSAEAVILSTSYLCASICRTSFSNKFNYNAFNLGIQVIVKHQAWLSWQFFI